ncbi:MAG TPA: DUF1702 family protein [Pyrinomonadaceae bacterium]|nr:DUF1702 family protein [Pyrinomonadaceae bacterium]
MATAVEHRRDLPLLGRLKGRLLGLSTEDASFSRHGFPGRESESRGHLESIIRTFIEGYNLSIVSADMNQLTRRLDASFPPAFVGFAYEGAGLYFAVADLLLPRSESRLRAFTTSAAARHDYIVSVGAGFAVARAPLGLRRMESYQRSLDPMSAWCLADGYGFHQGFFHWRRFVEARESAPASLARQNRLLFDAGVGRSMWWVFGADPATIASAISRFQEDRRAEMWAGIGTALAYASGGPAGAARLLLDLAGAYRTDLLSGVPLAAHMRDKGGNPAGWTEEVCAEVLGMTAAEASALVVAELNDYLDSWHGTERVKWDNCYVALRERVKRRVG